MSQLRTYLVDKWISIPLPHSSQHLWCHDHDTQRELSQEQKLTATLKEWKENRGINKVDSIAHTLTVTGVCSKPGIVVLCLWAPVNKPEINYEHAYTHNNNMYDRHNR